ncbi:RNA-directed DNA polymerase [Streptomyces bingchenggensis BCW-1]|uniref:RNA-directed DNA polymerase n=1 Tax=Streptomyces bingchenggensis (strain BCW-1) TaxID=749414 RepID=D7CDR9_STRBB|nr:group II intron reverse transcriptase/maturase [Streptomyces milbemycinicus]ADI04584.1 RNA-directed DNA polymerase [Streptomyces bingchenggensis BCW-1]
MNTDALEDAAFSAERRVLEIQAKLHRWARKDPHRRFDDLFNLVADPAFLLTAWMRVRGNEGARTPGVDGHTVYYVEQVRGVEGFLGVLRSQIKDRTFRPLPVRERMIPKATGKLRRLGIASVADRTVQASLKLVLEPIFEADFHPCSYGFRPMRRAHDAIAEVHYLASRPRNYEWIVEGDITACFDEIDHTALMNRVRSRIGDNRVLALVKAFLKAGILSEDGRLRATDTGTPQGSILSPLLSNVALSVLDEYFTQIPGGPGSSQAERSKRRRHGKAGYRLVRYADDFLVLVSGTREHAEQIRGEVAEVPAPMGLRLSEDKTLITHIDNGLDFLGWHIQRRRKRGTNQHYVYTYPSRKAVKAAMGKVRKWCRELDTNQPLDALLQLNRLLRGWCAYFRPGVSHAAFQYLSHYTWQRVIGWLRRKHPKNQLEEPPAPLLRRTVVATRPRA